jgi:hypothetical protein
MGRFLFEKNCQLRSVPVQPKASLKATVSRLAQYFRRGLSDGIVRDGSGQDTVNGYGKQRPLLHMLLPYFLSG